MPRVSELDTYLKGDHVKDGDILKFIDQGQITEKEFTKDGKTQKSKLLEMTVEVNNQRKMYSPNKVSRDACSKVWTDDTAKWVGHECRITVASQLVFDKVQKVIILDPINVSPN